jgi:3',5'-cyclic AMP phosphodiesterase CpdA
MASTSRQRGLPRQLAQRLASRLALAALLCAATAAGGWAGRPATWRQQPAAPLFTFGVIADVQYRDAAPSGTRFYRESATKLAEAVDRLNALRPAFTVQLGDLVDGAFASYDAVLPIFARLRSPGYHVLGNHDQSVEPERQAEVLRRLGLDRLGGGRGYYDFARDGWRFVVLNGNDLSVVAYPENSPEKNAAIKVLEALKTANAPNAQIWNGGIGAGQMEWLKRTLARAAASRERVVVFCHFPVLPAGSTTLWNDRELVLALDACPTLVAYVCGHKHEGDYVERNGVHFVTLQGMIEGHETAFALVEVHRDRLEMKGFGREGSRTLTLR